MISDVLVSRYRPAKLHEDQTYQELRDYLITEGLHPAEESLEKCQRTIAFRHCHESFTFAGTHTMVLQLLELNFDITSDLGTIVYHFIRKIDNAGRLWGQPEHLCLNGNALEVDDSSESDIVYMKSVANPDTPEYVCEHYGNNTNCLAAVEFMCSEFQGKCDEPVSRLINGHSKVGISNAINCTTSHNDERLVDKVKVYFMTGMTIVEKHQFETDQNLLLSSFRQISSSPRCGQNL